MIIEISKESANILEAYSYQVNSRKDIIIGVLTNSLSMNEERFIQYHKEYEQFYKAYQEAKEKLITPYIQEYFPDSWKNRNWRLNFSTGELEIDE